MAGQLLVFFNPLQFLLFAAYLVLITWYLPFIPFYRRSGLHRNMLRFLYLLRVLAGMAYGYVHAHAPEHVSADTWQFFEGGLRESQSWFTDPLYIFQGLLPSEKQGMGLFGITDNYWNDLKYVLMVKLSGFLNLLTGANYYGNLLFFELIPLAGSVLILQGMRHVVVSNVWAIFLVVLVPSVLFWTSGFHRDGVLFSCLAGLFYLTTKTSPPISIRQILIAILMMILIAILRLPIIIAVLTASLAYLLNIRYRQHPRTMGLIALGILTMLFFTGGKIHPTLDLAGFVVERQHAFVALGGNTRLDVPLLENNVRSFLFQLPLAIDAVLFHPYPFEGGLNYIPFTLDLWFAWLIVIYCLYRKAFRRQLLTHPSLLFSWILGLVIIIFIGFTVPNVGALIRYRSLAMPFLLIPFIAASYRKSNTY